MNQDGLIPSMFHRRLLLLVLLVVAGVAALSGQLYSLTIKQGEAHRADAFRTLVNEHLIPTTRGRIVDRRGRVLAEDAPSYELRVDYRVLTRNWADTSAFRQARREHADAWAALTKSQRLRLIERDYLHLYDQQIDALYEGVTRITGVPAADLEERRARIIEGVQRTWRYVNERILGQAREENRAKELAVEITLEDVAIPIAEQRQSHTLLSNLDDEAAFALRRLASQDDMPHDRNGRPLVEIVDSGTRRYPRDRQVVRLDKSHLPQPIREEATVDIEVTGVAWHLLGEMRSQINEEDAEREPRRFLDGPNLGQINLRGYRQGDSVGHRGLESWYEDYLRGSKGLVRYQRDTGEETRLPPRPGRDLELTIDVDLQARVQAILQPEFGLTVAQPWHRGASMQTPEYQNPTINDGDPLNAAVVVLDIDSGDILAMVSHPSVDRDDVRENPDTYFQDEIGRPTFDRTVQMPLPPGSIAKPLVLCMGVTEGVWPLEREVECHGHFLPDRNDIYRCWIYREHFGYQTHFSKYGKGLGPALAIAESCNIFFYTIAGELGPARIAKWYRRFGVERRIVFGLPDQAQYPGAIGLWEKQEPVDDADAEEEGTSPPPRRKIPLEWRDAVMMGIGQGPVTWTPMHAANAHATLARGGEFLPPRLLRSGPGLQEYTSHDLQLDPAAVEAALEGMRQSAEEDYGSSHHLSIQGVGRDPIINVPDIKVRAKTGTAQAPPIVRPSDVGPSEILRQGNHGWYVGTFSKRGEEEPSYVVAVVVEYGGSGGRSAGPVANQVVWALSDLGYLSR
jgi:penicillin-binding protein 2